MAEEKKTKTTGTKTATAVKKAASKTAVKKESAPKKAETKKAEPKKTEKQASLTIKVVGLDGTAKGNVELPAEVFGAKVNPVLMAQAVRVYLANQRQGTSSTKTRSEVIGSTKKIYRQKGTGRARHGAAKAPIFVGGGIAFGPKPRDLSLSFPKKMRKKALYSSLSAQLQGNNVIVVDKVDGLTGKTKEMYNALKTLNVLNKQKKAHKVLLVTAEKESATKRSARNIEGLMMRNVKDLNTYEVLNSKHIIFVKNSIEYFTNGGTK